eukprot:scaffold65009_cov45-Prasinocladus_malaysianus.AAC.1
MQYEASRKDIIGGVECDSDFCIVKVDEKLLNVLKFEDPMVIMGRSVTSLMSPLVAKIHQEIFRQLK